jgi:hypothetical protein
VFPYIQFYDESYLTFMKIRGFTGQTWAGTKFSRQLLLEMPNSTFDWSPLINFGDMTSEQAKGLHLIFALLS